MGLDNDTRGWIMTAISGVACIFGASIICVDVVVRQFPRMHNFKISESDAFLSASLSLSFGVMLFSSLFSMLPQSKNYLQAGGYSARRASFALIGLFLAGVLGIRILSRVIHKFIPSHIVDCDHTHEEEEEAKIHGEEMAKKRSRDTNGHEQDLVKAPGHEIDQLDPERTPLLSQTTQPGRHTPHRTSTAPTVSLFKDTQDNSFVTAPNSRRASSNLTRSLSRTFTKYVSSMKKECDEGGPCMGFSDPCSPECFRAVQKRGSVLPSHQALPSRMPTVQRMPSMPSDIRLTEPVPEESPSNSEANTRPQSPDDENRATRTSDAQQTNPKVRSHSASHHYHHPEHEHDHGLEHHHNQNSLRRLSTHSQSHSAIGEHHHHVPTNAFMSIGLQTSLAIALHKAPEGFITYATNHASPSLGFSVFMALFIHNISEGFAMSLPLYLALNSRFRAILWSSVLGGVSQPLGAGIAALWFKFSGDSGHLAPDEKIYGGMFAVTAGVMTSVALSLFAESLQLTHNKNTCIVFAFLGMGLLGVSFALTAS